jgi:predicted SAM-dependent methyltransferase
MKKLILGAGPNVNPLPGHVYNDIRPFTHCQVWDLNLTPWPWADNEFGLVAAIHVVEHLKDLISFMNEAHRILRKGGELYLETPNAGINIDLTHADPTHVRCYRPHSFLNYFTLQGIEQFGYTDKAWSIRFISGVNEENIRLSAEPLK